MRARGFYLWVSAMGSLMILGAGCDLFSPQTSKSTIEVSNTLSGSSATSCSFQANVDGGSNVSVSAGTYYTFPAVSPGNHTVNLSSSGGCSGPPCQFQNSSTNDSVNFNTTQGDVYVIKVANGAACQNLVVSGP